MATKRTPEVVEEVLRRLSDGEPLRQILRSDPKFPERSVWGDWCRADPELQARHNTARDEGFDAIALQTLAIADTPVEGIETVSKATGMEERRGDMLGHRRLQVETRLKLLAKWDPRRYGDKVQLSGDPDGAPIKTESTVTLTAEEAYKRMLGGG